MCACTHTHTRARTPSLTVGKLVQLRWQGTKIVMNQGLLGRDAVSRKASQHLGGQVFSLGSPAQPGKVEEKNSYSRGLPSRKIKGERRKVERRRWLEEFQVEFSWD